MANYLIGIDAGNTSSKAVIFDEFGTIIATAGTPSMHFERRGEGFEEFDPDNLWTIVSECIKEVLQKSGLTGADIKGIGVTSFGNGVTFVGKNGETIAPGVFSQDYRANSVLAKYKETGALDKINDIVKGSLFAGEPGPILRWYKDNDKEVYDKIGGVMMFKDYIMFKLTDVVATDLNCFGGSFMFDLETMEYSDELLKLYGIEELKDALPKLADSPTEIIGRVTAKAAALTGLQEGTPVVAGMMDILACLVGAGATGDGIYTAIAGSWSINETHSDRIVPNLSSNMPYIYKGQYLNCSYTGASGSNYEWFIRSLGGTAKLEGEARHISHFQVLDELIGSISPENARVFFSPFVAQPSIHVNAKANFFNMDLSTSYADICYAVAEGVSFIHKYHIDILKNGDLPLKEIRLTGGVARSAVWNRIFANVLRAPIVGVDCDETGALGSAIAAGIGAGIYKDYEDAFAKAVKLKDPVQPDPDTFEIYDKRYAEWTKLNEVMKTYWDWKG